MPSFLEREQLVPVAPSIAPADQVLGAFGTRQSLFGIGAAQLKSAYNSYRSMPLTNQQNQMQLDGLLKQAGTDIKKASVSDLSVGDNQSAALSAFDPIIKDNDIMGDASLTSNWNAGRNRAEADRISSGGKRFNSASLDAINYQQALYSKSDKGTWRAFASSKESYSPYYDSTEEMGKLQKMFKTDVIEKDQQNGAYITTSKDSSWYKDKWQGFVEANASPQLKTQLATQARAEYYRDMLTMPREAIVQKYTSLRNGLLSKQMSIDAQNMMNIGASLALFHDSKDNSKLRTQLLGQAAYLNDQYAAKKQVLNGPLENGEALGDVNNLAIGTRIAEGLGQRQYFDKIGDAFAHKEEKFSVKPDYAYLSLKRLQEQSREFGIRQSEVGRHNRALETHATNMEQIGMMRAQADIIRATKAGKGSGDDNDDGDPTNKAGGGLQNSNSVSPASNDEQSQKQGQNILDNLGNVQKKYNEVYDNTSSAIFSPQLMDNITKLANDPTKANLKLTEVPDPTSATDGTGGNRARLLKFMVAAGALNQDAGGELLGTITGEAYDPQKAAQDLTVSDTRQLLRTIFSDPKMLQKGIAAIKGNDPSVNSYAIAAELEKKKQRIDGEYSEIVREATPLMRTNLDKYSPLFESEYLSKGKIPTRQEVRKVFDNIPLSALKGQVPPDGSLFKSPGFKSQEESYRDAATDDVMKTILGTLGNNRTAYNTMYQNYFPDKGKAQGDNDFKNNLQVLIEGAEGPTKGLGSGMKNILSYARNHPGAVDYVRMNSVDEAHDIPYMQIYFKTPSNATERAEIPESGISIPTTNANNKFRQVPLDDRTLLLNNKALKFQAQYDDGTKSNLSIYNSSGDKSNPMFDINPDFSYKALDFDAKTGNIKGIMTVYKAEEVSNLTHGRPDMLPLAIGVDPTKVYNTLSNKLIKNRDAVNEYLKSNGAIKNINDLPEYIKNALRNNSF